MSSGSMRALKKRIAARDHNTCYMCGREADEGETYDLEHKRPISLGGSTQDPDNLGLICPTCHEIKSKAEAAAANRARRRTRG
jgi:5-methylcytosine-specific restriction protein A